jgi:predicted dehydrogenase
MKPRIRWGVIGSGGIARRRTIPEGIARAENAILAAVQSPNAGINAAVAREFGAAAGIEPTHNKPASRMCL